MLGGVTFNLRRRGDLVPLAARGINTFLYIFYFNYFFLFSGFIPLTKTDTANEATSSTEGKIKEPKPESEGDKEPDNGTSAIITTTTTTSSSSSSSSSTFVFGQSCNERVENAASGSEAEAKPTTTSAVSAAATSSSSFVFGQNLTSRAEKEEPSSVDATSNAADNPESSAESTAVEKKKTLTESAAEYCENHAAQKRKYEKITPVTGEEEERNVVQMNAKLFVFDKVTSNWAEKGRGTLRLNDYSEGEGEGGGGGSRIVMRTSGSLRVILNTKLYPGMSIELPSDKNVRMAGTDEEGHSRIFLVGGATKDVGKLYAKLKERTAEETAPAAKGENGGDTDVAAKKQKV
jgi:Ran-binding protein 3